MSALPATNYIISLALVVFDTQDRPKIFFRYPYEENDRNYNNQNLRSSLDIQDDVISEVLQPVYFLKNSSKRIIHLLASIDNLSLNGHIVYYSIDFIYCFVLLVNECELLPQEYFDLYYEISKNIGLVFKFEEDRCQYLSTTYNEVSSRILMNCDDDYDHLKQNVNRSCEIHSQILKLSSIAKEIKIIFEQIKSKFPQEILINDFIPLYLNTKTASENKIRFELKPYQTLLLKSNFDSKLLSNNSYSNIHKFSHYSSPFKNFDEISRDCNLYIDEVLKIAIFILNRECAHLIYPIEKTNEYVIHPELDVYSKTLRTEFALTFNTLNMSFHELLSKFSSVDKIEQILNFPEHILYNVIIWLLSNKVILQLHKYVALLPPLVSTKSSPFGYKFSTANTNTFLDETDDIFIASDMESSLCSPTATDITIEPSPLISVNDSFDEESESKYASYISQLFSKFTLSLNEIHELELTFSRCSELDRQSLLRLSPYFNGSHHVEEIIYNEILSGVNKKQLERLFCAFSNILVPHVRPEIM